MKKLLRSMMIIIAAALILVFGISAFVTLTASKDIVGTDSGSGIDQTIINECRSIDPQCILVLGCAVWADNQPSPMLKDRLDTAIELYKQGAAPKLLLSGDNSVPEYSEPDCMLAYALEQGVPAGDIFLDFAGFSTYESVYRAHAVFKADRMIVVTQKYHLYRALKTCAALGIEAKGVASNQQKYAGRYFREAREVLARDKDLVKGLFKPLPTYLGEEIPIEGDGNVTHLNDTQTAEPINVTFINDVEEADIWILPQTEENLGTSLWGKATIESFDAGAAKNVTISDPAADRTYIVRIIADGMYYFAVNDVLLGDGYTIHFTTEDRPFESTIDVIDRNGKLISSQEAFEGTFGAE